MLQQHFRAVPVDGDALDMKQHDQQRWSCGGLLAGLRNSPIPWLEPTRLDLR